jgi:hypothetical protein
LQLADVMHVRASAAFTVNSSRGQITVHRIIWRAYFG